jgi:hypothetical protein
MTDAAVRRRPVAEAKASPARAHQEKPSLRPAGLKASKKGASPPQKQAGLGLGHIVVLYHRSSNLYIFGVSISETTMRPNPSSDAGSGSCRLRAGADGGSFRPVFGCAWPSGSWWHCSWCWRRGASARRYTTRLAQGGTAILNCHWLSFLRDFRTNLAVVAVVFGSK